MGVFTVFGVWERYEVRQSLRNQGNWYDRPDGTRRKSRRHVWKETLSKRTRTLLEACGFAFFVAIPALLYLICRVFLVIVGFIGLRSLPALAFHTPEWTQYLAHL